MTEGPNSPLEVRERHDALGAYELHLVGEVDLSSLPILKAEVERVLASCPGTVRFELSEVTFMDSSGIGVLLEVADAVAEIALVNPSPAVVRLVELSGLSSTLPMLSLPVTS